jgi:hypothetical protein
MILVRPFTRYCYSTASVLTSAAITSAAATATAASAVENCRVAKIDEALLKQDKLYLESRKALLHRRPDTGFEAIVKRLSGRQGPLK